jgi:hypothetical protein
MERSYVAEMRDLIDKETREGPYVAATVATRIAEHLRANDPGLLRGWLDEQAPQFIRMAITERDHSDRAHARAVAGRSVFRDMAQAAEDGKPEALAAFLTTVYVIEDGSRVRLAEMRKPELLYVAETYEKRAAENAMQAAFLNVLARKVGRGRVSDHFDDVKLTELWQSIGAK